MTDFVCDRQNNGVACPDVPRRPEDVHARSGHAVACAVPTAHGHPHACDWQLTDKLDLANHIPHPITGNSGAAPPMADFDFGAWPEIRSCVGHDLLFITAHILRLGCCTGKPFEEIQAIAFNAVEHALQNRQSPIKAQIAAALRDWTVCFDLSDRTPILAFCISKLESPYTTSQRSRHFILSSGGVASHSNGPLEPFDIINLDNAEVGTTAHLNSFIIPYEFSRTICEKYYNALFMSTSPARSLCAAAGRRTYPLFLDLWNGAFATLRPNTFHGLSQAFVVAAPDQHELPQPSNRAQSRRRVRFSATSGASTPMDLIADTYDRLFNMLCTFPYVNTVSHFSRKTINFGRRLRFSIGAAADQRARHCPPAHDLTHIQLFRDLADHMTPPTAPASDVDNASTTSTDAPASAPSERLIPFRVGEVNGGRRGQLARLTQASGEELLRSLGLRTGKILPFSATRMPSAAPDVSHSAGKDKAQMPVDQSSVVSSGPRPLLENMNLRTFGLNIEKMLATSVARPSPGLIKDQGKT